MRRWVSLVLAGMATALVGAGADRAAAPGRAPAAAPAAAATIGPSRPWICNTHLVRAALASENARIVILGDSLMNLTTPGGDYKSGAAMLLQVGALGRVRAFQAGGADTFSMPVRIYATPPGSAGQSISLNHDTAKSVTRGPDAPEYIGLPVYCNGTRIDDPAWVPPGLAIGAVTLSLPWLADAAHPAWSPADSDGVGCRLIQFAPAGAPVLDRTLYIADGSSAGVVRAAVNLADDAELGPPVPGQFNRVTPDVLLTGDVGGGAKSAALAVDGAVGATGYALLVDPIFYHADDDGQGNPVRVPGNYVQVLARLSWSRWNFFLDKPATEQYPKSDTTDRYIAFMRATTLDAGQQPVIIVRVDTEYSEDPGNFSELGPTATMCTREDYRAAIEALMARMDAVFAAVPGSPKPIYWFQQPVHHWSGWQGFGGGPGASKDPAVNAERHNRLLEAMYDVCARPGSRAAYTSLFAFFQARLPHPNPTVDPVVRTVLDGAFGAGWVPPGTMYPPYTPGTGGDGGALLDSIGLHTRNAGAERVMAWVCRHSVETGVAPCAGDFDADGVVTIGDLFVFTRFYGRRVDASSAHMDLDASGFIDVPDLAPLIEDLGCMSR